MTQRRELQALIDAAPVSKTQWRVIICCFLVVMLDGFDTAAIGFIAPDIRTHWQLTAGDLAPLFGAGLFGLMTGALIFGPLADKIGRKPILVGSVFVFGLASLLSAFSPDMTTLVVLRFITGIGLGGAMPNAITLTSEYCPSARRSTLVTLMFCGFTVGSALGGIASAQLLSVVVKVNSFLMNYQIPYEKSNVVPWVLSLKMILPIYLRISTLIQPNSATMPTIVMNWSAKYSHI